MDDVMKYSGWRPLRVHRRSPRPADGVWEVIPPTRCFDQVSFIGDVWVGCLVVETSDGLLMVDFLEPTRYYLGLIESGLRALGHEPSEVRKIVCTHGHGDHYGLAGDFAERFGTEIYMTETDFRIAQNPPMQARIHGPITFDVTHYLHDMEQVTLGDTAITVVATPGHTPGTVSLIIPATDEGRPHRIALWGGTGIGGSAERIAEYRASAARFAAICEEMGADAELSNHPFTDMSTERLAICRNIVDGVANPFVVGTGGVQRYIQAYSDMALQAGKLNTLNH